MINVLHLINYSGKGGTEKYILTLIKNLDKNGCRFYLAYSIKGELIAELEKINIKTFKIPMRSCFDIRAAFLLKKICEKYSVDIVHTHFLRENCISILSKILGNKIKIINTRHMLTENSTLVGFINRISSVYVNRFIAVSNAVKEQLVREGISSSKISMIYNGVNLKYWNGKCEPYIRKELKIDGNDFVVTNIARFTEEKGHSFLFDSIKTFNKKNEERRDRRNIKFLLAGDGDLLEHFKNITLKEDTYSNVILTGYRKDIKSILDESDLYVSPSKSEAFGISIIEALACGKPVIATDTGGQAEILKGNKCGVLVNYGDIDSFCNAMMKFIYDYSFYNTCKLYTVKTVEEHFSDMDSSLNTYKIYEKCIGK
ncbi:MAG: glycosyltransferase [Clostridiales bacterium]|mgnify:FL=1|nr:glycosyltransferase [Clostridiales bacterium]